MNKELFKKTNIDEEKSDRMDNNEENTSSLLKGVIDKIKNDSNFDDKDLKIFETIEFAMKSNISPIEFFKINCDILNMFIECILPSNGNKIDSSKKENEVSKILNDFQKIIIEHDPDDIIFALQAANVLIIKILNTLKIVVK